MNKMENPKIFNSRLNIIDKFIEKNPECNNVIDDIKMVNEFEIVCEMCKKGEREGEKCECKEIRRKNKIIIKDRLKNMKQTVDFKNIIKNMSMKYIASGSTGHMFKIVNIDDETEYAMKVVPYPIKKDYGTIMNIKRPENVELLIIQILSDFVSNTKTPHVTLPVTTFNTNIRYFIKLRKHGLINNENEKYNEFLKKYYNKVYHNNVSILIGEWADSGNLLKYIAKNKESIKLIEWKVILFQVISTLAIIQGKYPTFKHNDFKSDNILLSRTILPENINKKNIIHEYKIINKTFKVPDIGYQIKIWDFDFSCIKPIINNIKVDSQWANDIGINSKKNKYYDIHFFVNTLIGSKNRTGFIADFMTNKSIPSEVKNFLTEIVPDKYREGDHISKKGRLMIDDQYTTPFKIISQSEFFKEFRKN